MEHFHHALESASKMVGTRVLLAQGRITEDKRAGEREGHDTRELGTVPALPHRERDILPPYIPPYSPFPLSRDMIQ